MPRPDAKDRVHEAFLEMENDSTPGEIADKSGVSRRTAKKWIERLLAEGKIEKTREVGRTNLYQITSQTEETTNDKPKAASSQHSR